MAILPKKVVLELNSYKGPTEGRFSFVRLDFNENTTGFPEAYPSGMPAVQISAYPEYGDFTARLASFYKVAPDSLLLTNGSDEGLFILPHTFIEPGEDVAVTSTPCFVVIPHCLKLAGATLKEVPVRADLSFDIDGIEKALSEGAKMAVFATPENPTGCVLAPEIILDWCQRYPDTLFVIDEAYGEFAETSLVDQVAAFKNLVVLKTFSKAWGMAGLRLGIMFGAPEILEYVQRVRLPYTVNSAAIWTAAQLLDRAEEVSGNIQTINAEKNKLADQLQTRGFRIDNGFSNSVLIGAGINAQRLSDYCRQQGVLIRNRSSVQFPPDMNGSRPVMWGKVRVSIGTSEENDKFVRSVENFHKSYGILFDLDGTLVDTTDSFDRTVADLVAKHSGRPLAQDELRLLRAEGGFNDDWVAAHELLRRRGVDVNLQELVKEAAAMYLKVARESENPLFQLELIKRLQKRHPLFIVTGRTRGEYEPVWADRLDQHFERVYCLYDLSGKKPKPSPDYLLHVLEEHKLEGGAYIGNNVDDMHAARAAGLDAIGVTTTHSADVLREAGAQLVVPTLDSLVEVFML